MFFLITNKMTCSARLLQDDLKARWLMHCAALQITLQEIEMSLSDPIQIRLHIEQHLRYEAAAARIGKPLATYLRECLETYENDHSVASLKREFLALRHTLEDWADKPTSSGVEFNSNPLLMEVVLLLRQLAKPEHVRIAQGELKRLGVISE